MDDEFAGHYGDLLTGSYDCVDRIVLNAYYPLGSNPGGFRTWWRRLHDEDESRLDDAHLMRMAGRFARRVRGWAGANKIPVIDCKAGERKHLIAEQYLAEHPGQAGRGVFLILVGRAPATVWTVNRSSAGVIRNLEKKRQYVNHYSFHILDPDWGHITIKMSGHPPFGAQVILNGHEYVTCLAAAEGIDIAKEGNCFTQISDPDRLAQLADTLSRPGIAERLAQLIDRWIYSACLCFGLDIAEQEHSGFRYSYSVYQLEYSRNLIFTSGRVMERVFDTVVDRTRTRLDVPTLRTLFGVGARPHRRPGQELHLSQAVMIEKPKWNLTIFKINFGKITLKGYTKGEHVLRFEAIVHNTKALRTGRVLQKFPEITARLAGMVDRFTNMLDCVDTSYLPDGILDDLPAPTMIGATRIAGLDTNKPRIRAALSAVTALAPSPFGFTVSDFAQNVRDRTGQTEQDYTIRQAAYDLRKIRGKDLLDKPAHTRRYRVRPEAARTIAGITTLRDQVIAPILAGVRSPRPGRPPKTRTQIDRDYDTLRADLRILFTDLGIRTAA